MTSPLERENGDVEALFERPRADELVRAVIEFLEGEVLETAEGELRHRLRVSLNVLATVERELGLTNEFRDRHRENLARLGVSSDEELARVIRRGDLVHSPILREILMDETVRRLEVANPRWLIDDSH
jgi:hypothetical protein